MGLGADLIQHDAPLYTTLPRNGILDDTSLAAVVTREGNKHVFFQDRNQSLRQAVYSHAAGKWLDGAGYVYTKALPRNHTPIAAVTLEPLHLSDNYMGPKTIYIFFIDTNGLLAGTTYIQGQGFTDNHLPSVLNDSFQTASGSRTLSLAWSQNTRAPSLSLLYEAPTGNITVLRSLSRDASDWHNISESVYAPLLESSLWLRPPVALRTTDYISSKVLDICFINPTTAMGSSISFVNWFGLRELPMMKRSDTSIR